METIEVDQDVYAKLEAVARPFVETTPNAVLRRVLGLDEAGDSVAGETMLRPGTREEARPPHRQPAPRGARSRSVTRPKANRAPAGALLPEEAYELPLLRALDLAGGRAPSKEVIETVGRELKDDLTALDQERLQSGGIRWQSRIQFVRLRMIERGLMDRNSPRGVWTLTDLGRERVATSSTEGTK